MAPGWQRYRFRPSPAANLPAASAAAAGGGRWKQDRKLRSQASFHRASPAPKGPRFLREQACSIAGGAGPDNRRDESGGWSPSGLRRNHDPLTVPIDPGLAARRSLNAGGLALLASLLETPADHAAAVRQIGGCRVVDCGVAASGSDALGLLLARVAMGGLGEVWLRKTAADTPLAACWPDCPWPIVEVSSEEPVAACLAAQYAGWKIAEAGYFAMASGPLRAAIAGEDLFDSIGLRERPAVAVGLLEADGLPPEAICRSLAERAGVSPESLVLLVAATASPAGTLQVVARSLETALHQLHERRFDLGRIIRGRAAAPLPPVASDSLAAIGRTNDAILYGGRAWYTVETDDAEIEAIIERLPSSASRDYGTPFYELFQRYDGDFYQIDPLLFSPAAVSINNVTSGRTFQAGQVNGEMIRRSLLA